VCAGIHIERMSCVEDAEGWFAGAQSGHRCDAGGAIHRDMGERLRAAIGADEFECAHPDIESQVK